MIRDVKTIIERSEPFTELVDRLPGTKLSRPVVVSGVTGSLLAFLAVHLFTKLHRQVFLIAPGEERAARLRDDCAVLGGEGHIVLFDAQPVHSATMFDVGSSVARIETLDRLSSGDRVIVVASPRSVAEPVPPREHFQGSALELTAGGNYPFTTLPEHLDKRGFERKDFVEGVGDYAVRGGIVDIFPFHGEHPMRIEFWGDAVESVREFDVVSQRSIREILSVKIFPNIFFDSDDGKNTAEKTTTGPAEVGSSIFDYLDGDAVVILDEPDLIAREIVESREEGAENLFTYDDIERRASVHLRVVQHHLTPADGDTERDGMPIDFGARPQPAFNGSIRALVDGIRQFDAGGYITYILSDTSEGAVRIRELIAGAVMLEEEGGGRDEVREAEAGVEPHVLVGTVHAGFIYPPGRVAVLTEHEIFGRLKRTGAARRRRLKGLSQRDIRQLRPGDYVVHVDHGIGMFEALDTIKVGGVEQEVMKLIFDCDDVLYVNLNFVNRVQKYSSQEGHTPQLNKLGGSDWQKTTSRARRKIKDIARELITLYARRKHETGFAFSPDTPWQKELEASFMYEDTPDQASATTTVKQDMENPSPMDRLICGDVGFGKTEIAVRAAFKAVMDGKQVALLVPTTILAIQHRNTFRDRLSRYTTHIEDLTRFRSAAEQRDILAALRSGAVDIVIGTHRLLSDDVGFKDLGLLIIDEEHRFGVSSKEKLRKIKASVDTLTLTATPIPRTLNFSLLGARDLSIITTPPRNRFPIHTELIAADGQGRRSHWRIVREAILHELHRHGQVYVVHDRVETIDAVAQQVMTAVPEARVRVAHGQMPGHELERRMLAFLERKYDVLVCTKIIESGLDIPNVNTIIIHRADRFGLAELYQLRGRVGRSNVQAFAYLIVPPLSVLPKTALRRLQSMEEFTELGSGFNLAMRDLEIRGAGNLLGAEQSGFILDLGFEMYERIVREAVEELKGEEFAGLFAAPPSGNDAGDRKMIHTVIEANVEALIPAVYIGSDAERLDVYRRLYRAVAPGEFVSLRAELIDRFGEFPVEVEHLLLLAELRCVASQAGFPKVELLTGNMHLTMPDAADDRFYGTEDDPEAPFRRLMAYLACGTDVQAHLKQTGKILTLHVPFHVDASDPVRPALQVVKAIHRAMKGEVDG